MRIFIAGASGATGQRLTAQLLEREQEVVAVVRSTARLPEALRDHPRLSLVEASLLELSQPELTRLVDGCGALASCLGHNLTLKGMFGPPRRLVTDAVRCLCQAVRACEPEAPVRFVLMNTTANRDRDLAEPQSAGEKLVIGLLRLLLPPQADNEAAAEYLRTGIGQNDPLIEWCAVRPDNLVEAEQVSAYSLQPSPTRSPIFDPGQTSRINVGHFMAELITDDAVWAAWKGKMPVIYNQDSVDK